MKGIILFSLMVIISAFLSGCAGLSPSPLNQAAWDNDVNKIKALVDSGALVDEVAPCPRKTFKVFASSPLDLAVLQGNLEAVKALLDAGADVNLSRYCHAITSSPEEFPRTPSQGYYAFKGSALMLSSLIGNLEISRLLLDSGADVNQLTEKGLWGFSELSEFDALSFSAELGHSDITRLLLKYGADPSTSSYNALERGRMDYLVILLEENSLKIESDPKYMHYNAELAHLAADFYAQTDEEKAVQFYKKAVEFYPQGIENYKSIAAGYKQKEYAKAVVSVAAVVLGAYGAKTQANMMAQNTGYGVATYSTQLYNPNMSGAERNLLKAHTSENNYNTCKAILDCYETLESNMTLVDCVENAKVVDKNQTKKK
ncbi:MAG: ankyrin repeat domain-containing protein [Desulfobacteraceae bacterium]|nr:MAG: ankyrin repeat domain-containing protein [Desulfobacteraceae bacterium]